MPSELSHSVCFGEMEVLITKRLIRLDTDRNYVMKVKHRVVPSDPVLKHFSELPFEIRSSLNHEFFLLSPNGLISSEKDFNPSVTSTYRLIAFNKGTSEEYEFESKKLIHISEADSRLNCIVIPKLDYYTEKTRINAVCYVNEILISDIIDVECSKLVNYSWLSVECKVKGQPEVGTYKTKLPMKSE